MERFQREARLLAQLNHTNSATIHGLEEHDAQQVLVMELVEGDTLAERIARGPIPIDETIAIFTQIAEGLEAAHEKGIIHLEQTFYSLSRARRAYDISADGSRFLMIEEIQDFDQPTEIHVVLNWLDEVERLTAEATN